METGIERPPHQQRVLEEKRELDIKRDTLTEFLKGDLYRSLPEDEQERMARQLNIMELYSNVLSERIIHF